LTYLSKKRLISSVAQRGVVRGCSPSENFCREKYPRGNQGKNRQKFTPLENFVEKKISKVKFNPPPSNFENFSELALPSVR
jgi:hypothetical protein